MIFKNKAEYWADMAHSSISQRRKYTNEPYINHPRKVAYLVQVVGGSSDMISAAYLHDVLEDVAPQNPLFNEENIRMQFGNNVTDLVKWLTDISKKEDGNRDVRKKMDRDHIASAPPEAKTIKLADLIDNSLTICEYDPGFARLYLKEKRLALEVLKDGSSVLWNMANDILLRNGY